MALTYEQIIESIVVEANITRVAFEKLTIEQRVFLVSRYLGASTSKLYEELNEAQVVELASEKTQGKFTYTFKYIKESTALFTEISTMLNTTLYGIYGAKTRYFMLTETFKSFLTHLDKAHLIDNILNDATAKATSASVSVPSIGNAPIGVSALEIRAILDKFTKPIYDKQSPTFDIIVESLLLSLLDVKYENEARIILNNFENITDTITTLGDNLVKEAYIGITDNIVADGLVFTIDDGEASEIRLYNDGVNILTTDDHLVEVDITRYESGSLRIFFGGTVIYNATPTKGTLSFSSASPGTSKHTSLVIQSDDFKGALGNISVRKITS